MPQQFLKLKCSAFFKCSSESPEPIVHSSDFTPHNVQWTATSNSSLFFSFFVFFNGSLSSIYPSPTHTLGDATFFFCSQRADFGRKFVGQQFVKGGTWRFAKTFGQVSTCRPPPMPCGNNSLLHLYNEGAIPAMQHGTFCLVPPACWGQGSAIQPCNLVS